jgi:hypothetical protein
MIESLFGSKTRVKLLKLFLNNPDQPYYVREITRKVDEQINSVRRELSNMLQAGILTSLNKDNKLFYQIDKDSEYFSALRDMFTSGPKASKASKKDNTNKKSAAVEPLDGTEGDEATFEHYKELLSGVEGIRLVVLSGSLVGRSSSSSVDLLIVGVVGSQKIKTLVSKIEKHHGRTINYTTLPLDEFYYRLSVRDRFLGGILNSDKKILFDKDSILNKG